MTMRWTVAPPRLVFSTGPAEAWWTTWDPREPREPPYRSGLLYLRCVFFCLKIPELPLGRINEPLSGKLYLSKIDKCFNSINKFVMTWLWKANTIELSYVVTRRVFGYSSDPLLPPTFFVQSPAVSLYSAPPPSTKWRWRRSREGCRPQNASTPPS